MQPPGQGHGRAAAAVTGRVLGGQRAGRKGAGASFCSKGMLDNVSEVSSGFKGPALQRNGNCRN